MDCEFDLFLLLLRIDILRGLLDLSQWLDLEYGDTYSDDESLLLETELLAVWKRSRLLSFLRFVDTLLLCKLFLFLVVALDLIWIFLLILASFFLF